MIQKIKSGGQTGVGRAVLDFAIKFNIPYGGWILSSRVAEDGPLPDRYQLRVMTKTSFSAGIELNILESDGTLLFSRGEPTGSTEYTRKMSQKHKRQLFHIDLNLTTSYDAATLIRSWIRLNDIKVLNVAGPRASEDGRIYIDVLRNLEMAYVMHKIENLRAGKQPKTVESAIDSLMKVLSLKDKTTIANMAEDELSTLHFNLGEYIRDEFGLFSGNENLMTSCCLIAKRGNLHQNEASSIIIRKLWERLQGTHRLRVVK